MKNRSAHSKKTQSTAHASPLGQPVSKMAYLAITGFLSLLLITGCTSGMVSLTSPSTASTSSTGGTISTPPGGDTTGVTAVSADMFLSSTGVNTHVDQGYNANNYVTPLQYLGIRNLRDGERGTSGIIMLRQQAGVRLAINGGADLTGVLAAAKTLAASDALLAFDGPNEPNNFTLTYNGATGGGYGAGTTWVPVADFQRDLYSAVKADAILSKYPVFSPSEVGAETDNVGLQFLTIPTGAGALLPDGTRFADYANPHNYVSSTNSSLYTDNQAWQAADPTLNSTWDGLYGDNGRTWSQHFTGYSNTDLMTLPRVTTETGYDSVSNPGGETIQGKVLLNTYFSQFKRGWRYTFIYELVDGEGGTGNQGLFHSDYSPKLVATYIHNTTSVLADTTAISNPGMLNYSIANEPATVHDLLLQKSDGTFEIAVWGEAVSATNNIVVNLTTSRGTVHVYDPTLSATPQQTLSNVSQVPLTMTDHLMIVEVK